MKSLLTTAIFAPLALCITAQTNCTNNQTTSANQLETVSTTSSSTGTHHDETTMTTKPATLTYIIAGGVSALAIVGCILAMRHFMSRNHELPFIAVEDPAAPLALSQVRLSEVV